MKKFDELDVVKTDFMENEDEGEEETKEMKDESKPKIRKENFDKKYQKLSSDIKDIVIEKFLCAPMSLCLS